MTNRSRRLLRHSTAALAAALVGAQPTLAEDLSFETPPEFSVSQVPALQELGRVLQDAQKAGSLTLNAYLTKDGAVLPSGLVWRVFSADPRPDGKLAMVASAEGGSASFDLAPGTYFVHAAFGQAGATKRVTIDDTSGHEEDVILDAGGLTLTAVLSDGEALPNEKVRYSIYGEEAGLDGERMLILPDVEPGRIVRLSSGMYHIVSKFGDNNAIVRTDLRVDAGKLTEASVQHRAAEVTLKLVRRHGGEAIANTSWSVTSEGGEFIREIVGAYATLVLSEGSYNVVASYRGELFEETIEVVSGQNDEFEVVAGDGDGSDGAGGDIGQAGEEEIDSTVD